MKFLKFSSGKLAAVIKISSGTDDNDALLTSAAAISIGNVKTIAAAVAAAIRFFIKIHPTYPTMIWSTYLSSNTPID